jgi:hypothetical protein
VGDELTQTLRHARQLPACYAYERERWALSLSFKPFSWKAYSFDSQLSQGSVGVPSPEYSSAFLAATMVYLMYGSSLRSILALTYPVQSSSLISPANLVGMSSVSHFSMAVMPLLPASSPWPHQRGRYTRSTPSTPSTLPTVYRLASKLVE